MKEKGQHANTIAPSSPPSEGRETRQFGIRGMMWFTLLCALWIPQPTIFAEFWTAPRGFDLSKNNITVASVVIAWAVLAFACYRQRFYGIFLCHLLLPIIMTALIVLNHGSGNLRHGLVLFALVMNLICFPGMVVAMATRWLRRPAPPTKPLEPSKP
jgi:hypothetical protein